MGRYRKVGLLVGAIASVGIVASISNPTQADTYSATGSVELASLPTAQDIKLAQFDPALGTLTSITVTAHLDGGIDAEVTNLSRIAQATTVVFDSSATADGPGGIDLAVSASDSSTAVLSPQAPATFALRAMDDDERTTTAVGDLAAFTGTGTVDYIVNGTVQVNVFGPAKWRTRGVATATATVTVRYDYTPPNTTTSSSTTTTGSSTTTTGPEDTTGSSSSTTTSGPEDTTGSSGSSTTSGPDNTTGSSGSSTTSGPDNTTGSSGSSTTSGPDNTTGSSGPSTLATLAAP